MCPVVMCRCLRVVSLACGGILCCARCAPCLVLGRPSCVALGGCSVSSVPGALCVVVSGAALPRTCNTQCLTCHSPGGLVSWVLLSPEPYGFGVPYAGTSGVLCATSAGGWMGLGSSVVTLGVASVLSSLEPRTPRTGCSESQALSCLVSRMSRPMCR